MDGFRVNRPSGLLPGSPFNQDLSQVGDQKASRSVVCNLPEDNAGRIECRTINEAEMFDDFL